MQQGGESDSEYVLNLRQNIDDCLGVLGTLNVGLDVNPRFHDVEAFEATKELTVFDLLDIRLGEGGACRACSPVPPDGSCPSQPSPALRPQDRLCPQAPTQSRSRSVPTLSETWCLSFS